MAEEYSDRLRQLIEAAKTRRLEQFRKDFDSAFSAELREILGVSYGLNTYGPVAAFRAGDEEWTIAPGYRDVATWVLYKDDADEDPDGFDDEDDLLLLLDEAFPGGTH